MGFAAPWFLLGLAAAALPLWLHLLRRERQVPKLFSSLMFFERRTQSSILHRRLRYLVLLSLRLALIALLVLAFAEPFLRRQHAPGAAQSKLVVAAIDNSFSMRQGGQLDRARREAVSVIGGLRPGSLGQVLSFGAAVREMSQPVSDPAQLRAAVAAIEPGDERSSFGELARALRAMAEASRLPLEVHLWSDMQNTSMPPGFGDLQLPGGARLILHATADGSRANWAVENVAAPRRVNDPRKVRILATVAGFGTPAAAKRVSLLAGGRVLDTKTVTVPASGRASAEFLSLDGKHGFTRCEARLEETDSFPDDNRLVFAVEHTDPQRILFVHEARQPRALLYFSTAMNAAQESSFAIDAATPDRLGGIAFSQYALIVLSDVAALSRETEGALRSHVLGGGSLLIALGPAAATRARVPVFDEAIAEARYASRSGQRFFSGTAADAAHPVLQRAAGFEAVRLYQVVVVQPGSARVLARLADSTPILLEKRLGEGRVLVFASAFDNISNDLPLHGVFIPFLEQTAIYLSRQDETPAHLVVGSAVELRAARDRATSVEVIDARGRRALTLEESARADSYQLPAEGFYEIRRSNGRQAMIAANADRRESDLTPVPKETLALWQNTGSGAPSAAGGVSAAVAERPWGIWWYVLLALALVSVAESLFASRYLSREGDAAELVEREREAA